MWPFGRREAECVQQMDEAVAQMKDDVVAHMEAKAKVQACEAMVDLVTKRQTEQVEAEARAKKAAEQEAAEHDLLGHRRTIIYLKTGRIIVLRGVRMRLQPCSGYRWHHAPVDRYESVDTWDESSTLRFMVPIASIEFVVGDQVADKPPETSIEYRTTPPDDIVKPA